MKRFHTDHYFQIGSAHYHSGKPCQDYALSGSSSEAACAIVSDGCSTGRHTDVGSRLQALTLLKAMSNTVRNRGDTPSDTARIIKEEKTRLFSEARATLGLSLSDMLSTSVYAYLSQKGGYVHIEGDGVVAKKYKDGHLEIAIYAWKENTPYYPAYSGLDLVEFVAFHGGDLEAKLLACTVMSIAPDGSSQIVSVSEFTLREGIEGIIQPVTAEELEEIDFLAVFTDGVQQIGNVPWADVVLELMAFKSLEGEFAKRRMIRGLRQYDRAGQRPVDDVSIAVIRIEDLKEEEVANVISNDEGQSQDRA